MLTEALTAGCCERIVRPAHMRPHHQMAPLLPWIGLLLALTAVGGAHGTDDADPLSNLVKPEPLTVFKEFQGAKDTLLCFRTDTVVRFQGKKGSSLAAVVRCSLPGL